MKKKLATLLLYVLSIVTTSSGQSTWIQKADFTNSRLLAFSFSINGYGYIGRGVYGNVRYDMWRYDPLTDSWAQMAMPSTDGFIWVIGFSDSKYGYVGTGRTLGGNGSSDFWRYNPDSNTWVQRSPVPGAVREGAFGFYAGGSGFIGGGSNFNRSVFYNDFYKFDTLTNSWTNVTSCPVSIRSPGMFDVNGKGYLVCGKNLGLGYTSETWEYDPATNNWTQRADFPGVARYEVGSFSMNGKGYVGAGYRDSSINYTDFYEYDPIADTWSPVVSYPGNGFRGPSGFSINGKGYLAGGGDLIGLATTELWELSTNPSSVKESLGMQNEFSAFFNPDVDELFISIQSPIEKNSRLEIYNQTGNLVYADAINTSTTIKVETFPAGVYFVNLISERSRKINKVFIN